MAFGLRHLHLGSAGLLDELDDINGGLGKVHELCVLVVLAVVTAIIAKRLLDLLAKVAQNVTSAAISEIGGVSHDLFDVFLLSVFLLLWSWIRVLVIFVDELFQFLDVGE